jgi:hypothetical protein
LNNLTSINRSLKKENNSLKHTLLDKKKQKEALLKFIKDRENIINTIYIEKKSYIPKSLLIASLSDYLYSNKVYLNKINFSEDNTSLVLSVYAKDDKYITNFIDNVIRDEHLVVNTPGYKKTENFYIADIKIKVK